MQLEPTWKHLETKCTSPVCLNDTFWAMKFDYMHVIGSFNSLILLPRQLFQKMTMNVNSNSSDRKRQILMHRDSKQSWSYFLQMLELCVFPDGERITLLLGYCAVKKITGLEIKSFMLIPSLPLNYFMTQGKFLIFFFWI